MGSHGRAATRRALATGGAASPAAQSGTATRPRFYGPRGNISAQYQHVATALNVGLAPRGLRSGARFALARARGSARLRHLVTAVTGRGRVLCEVEVFPRDEGRPTMRKIEIAVWLLLSPRPRWACGRPLYGRAVEGWEGGGNCGVGSDRTACDYGEAQPGASRRSTGRILTE